jgi:hypothetical protein
MVVAAPTKGRSRAVARARDTTVDKAAPSKRALIPMPPCPGAVCPACWNERHGRQAGGAHDRGWHGLRCLLPLQGKRRRTVAEAGLEEVFSASAGAGEGVGKDRGVRAADDEDDLLAGDGDLDELEWGA